jgi:hypothetical protein
MSLVLRGCVNTDQWMYVYTRVSVHLLRFIWCSHIQSSIFTVVMDYIYCIVDLWALPIGLVV